MAMMNAIIKTRLSTTEVIDLLDQISDKDRQLLGLYEEALSDFTCPGQCGRPLSVSVHIVSAVERCPVIHECCPAGREEAYRLLSAAYPFEV